MPSVRKELESRISAVLADMLSGHDAEPDPMLKPTQDPKFGDYQSNSAMILAKRLKRNPRELAAKIISHLDLTDIADSVEIAGPGFINIKLSNKWLADQLDAAAPDQRLGIAKIEQPQTVVVDYSAPNLAKEMHVGHLRSTIIGDAVVRALEFCGHQVIRHNHMGDWGTQFGMLIAHLEDVASEGKSTQSNELADLENFYRQAKLRFDEEEGFADRARDYVVRLQSGDAHCLGLWQQFISISISHSEDVYRLLNVTLREKDIRPESAYNDELPDIVAALDDKNLLEHSDGARVVFLEEMRDRNDQPMAVIIQKSDGGYLYATTDLAAARHRAQDLHADRILYFIDDRQKLHMRQVFAISRRADFVSDNCSLEHHPFGKMLGDDGKPFKTRAGGTIKLTDLLNEAIERATRLLAARDSTLSEKEISEIARKVGIGAIKYADLSKNRTSDYVFSWEQMLSFEGNTAPYLQYAYTRIRSIFRRGEIDPEGETGPTQIEAPEERALAIKLLRFNEALDSVTHDAYPHLMCTYLFELAGQFMRFYEHCPVLQESVTKAQRDSRLRLCQLCARTLERGLDMLGIEVMERM